MKRKIYTAELERVVETEGSEKSEDKGGIKDKIPCQRPQGTLKINASIRELNGTGRVDDWIYHANRVLQARRIERKG